MFGQQLLQKAGLSQAMPQQPAQAADQDEQGEATMLQGINAKLDQVLSLLQQGGSQ